MCSDKLATCNNMKISAHLYLCLQRNLWAEAFKTSTVRSDGVDDSYQGNMIFILNKRVVKTSYKRIKIETNKNTATSGFFFNSHNRHTGVIKMHTAKEQKLSQ